jgi:hypothetical protein
VAGALAASSALRADTDLAPPPSPAPEAIRPSRWGFDANVGWGSLDGDLATSLRTPIAGELDLFRANGPWRFGLGVSFGSLRMVPPYFKEREWGFQRTYLFATRMLATEAATFHTCSSAEDWPGSTPGATSSTSSRFLPTT